ncbi:MAG: cupin domain-containing protein [Acidobacteriota bacterium]
MIKTSHNQLVRTNEIKWMPLDEDLVKGVFIKSLLFDEENKRSPTILLRFEAGATYPLHNHPGGEEIYVLEGDVKLGKTELKTGDYLFTAVNHKHRVSTQNGCILLLKVPQPVKILESRGENDLGDESHES